MIARIKNWFKKDPELVPTPVVTGPLARYYNCPENTCLWCGKETRYYSQWPEGIVCTGCEQSALKLGRPALG